MASLFVIHNPVSGTGDPDELRGLIADRCEGRGLAFGYHRTAPDDDVPALARDAVAAGARLVVAAGGDGTVSAVAGGLIGGPAALGILPAGTANVLAAELGLPADLAEALDLLLDAPATRLIDAMELGGRHFLLHVGVGLTALMHQDTDRAAKRRFGRLAYVWSGARIALGFQPRRFTIVVDGVRYRRSASQVMIANGGTLGAAPMRWAEGISPDDGAVDVCVLYARTILDYLRFGVAALSGRQHTQRLTVYRARREVSLSTRERLPVQADGELVGQTPVQLRVVPAALRVVVPALGEA